MNDPVSPKEARRYLRTITDESNHFHAKDGTKLANLFDLYVFLKNCDDETFRHHVDGSNNDIANWINNVIMDLALASDLNNCIRKQPMQHRLINRINFLVANSTRKLSGPQKAYELLDPVTAPEEVFVASDGRTLTNLWELYHFLDTTDQESFQAHVSEGKNDIANWLDEAVLDWELADRIRDVKDKNLMLTWVGLRLKTLADKAEFGKNSDTYFMKVMKALE